MDTRELCGRYKQSPFDGKLKVDTLNQHFASRGPQCGRQTENKKVENSFNFQTNLRENHQGLTWVTVKYLYKRVTVIIR